MTTNRYTRLLAIVPIALAVGACHGDYLTGSDLSTNPSAFATTNIRQLFTVTQPNIWAELGSDMNRIPEMWVQHFSAANLQYTALYQYQTTEATTAGFHQSLYLGGGLVDMRKIQDSAKARSDNTYLGIAQVEEGLLMGSGADLFGDLAYNEALKNATPHLDPQLTVYDTVQAVLSRGVTSLATTASTNVGPGAADLNYQGNSAKWTAVAHTLKARFMLHTAKVRGANAGFWAAIRDQAALGILTDGGADDYKGVFSAASTPEDNLYYQFNILARAGYLVTSPYFVSFIKAHALVTAGGAAVADPRDTAYFTGNVVNPKRQTASSSQPYVTAAENLLIWSEALYMTGDQAGALAKLQQEQIKQAKLPGMTANGTTGNALLKAILDEKYIAMFENLEAFNDYKRNCYPNVAPPPGITVKMPGRFYYDSGERATDPNIPVPGVVPNGYRNADDPASTTDPFGNACLAQ